MRGTRLLLALAASASLAMPEAAAQAPQGSVPQVSPTEDLRSAKPGAQPAVRFVPLEISINGARAGNWVLMERDGILYAPPDAFDEWRLNRDPRAPAVMQRGQAWYPLASLPGFAARFNPRDAIGQFFANGERGAFHLVGGRDELFAGIERDAGERFDRIARKRFETSEALNLFAEEFHADCDITGR